MTHMTDKSKRQVRYEYDYEPESRRRTSSASVWPWLLGALALSTLGFLAWPHLFSSRPVESSVVQTQSPTEAFDKLGGVKVGDVDLDGLVKSAVGGLQSSLGSIKDVDSAQAAMPGLTQAASQFDQLSGLLSQLTPETRKATADSFAAIRPKLNTLFDQAVGFPGVGPVIRPTVDAIRAKLDTLATA